MPAPNDSSRKLTSPVLPMIGIAALDLFMPFLPISSQWAALGLGVLLTLFYVGCIIGFALAIARCELSVSVSAALLALAALVWCSVEWAMQPQIDAFARTIAIQGGAPTMVQQITVIAVSALRDLSLIGAASFAGSLLARGIRYPNMLGPIGAIIAVIDIWGVLFGGIVSQMLNNQATAPLAQKAMTSGPQIGAISAAKPEFSLSLPSIGIGDFLFLALLLCALVNLKMNWRSSAIWMFIFVSIALLGITFLPWFPALPGLLFIGAGAVLPNLKYFSFTRDERFALLWAGVLVLVLSSALYFGFKVTLPDAP